MTENLETTAGWAAFLDHALVARGSAADVAAALHARLAEGAEGVALVFDPEGRQVDLDLRGTEAEARARHAPAESAPPRGRGRPKLGVVAREVTLLPRHWDWLAKRGGASVALRRLVEAARKEDGQGGAKEARDAAWRFMSAIGGDLPQFEEASRALYAGDANEFRARLASWPKDLAAHANRLAEPAFATARTPEAGPFLEVRPQAVQALFRDPPVGSPLMLNLVRLKATADYAHAPHLAPPAPVSGAEAFDRYVALTLPILRESGGDLVMLGRAHASLIGPAAERWDRVMLVRQRSLESFLAHAQDPRVAAILPHRVASVADSRLIPLSDLPSPDPDPR